MSTYMNKTDIQFNNPLSAMELAKLEMKRINDYDYNKMLEEFKFQDSLNKLKKTRIQKIKTSNSVYKKNVDRMHEKVEEVERQRVEEVKKVLREKNRIVEANKYEKKKEKEEKMLQAKNERSKMEQTAREKAAHHRDELEEKRIEERNRTNEKLKVFSENYDSKLADKQLNFSKKLQESQEKYVQHYQICLEQDASLKQLREEEKLKKYTDNFWKQKEREKEFKVKKKKVMDQLGRVQELKDEREERLLQRKNRLVKKINEMTRKRELLEEERHRKLLETIREEQRKKNEVQNNLQELRKDEEFFRASVLQYQREMVGRGIDKDNATCLKRSTAQESTVIGQIEVTRSLPIFTREMNQLKDMSISKKNEEAKKKIYKEILRAEQERKKKEADDKLHKS